MTYINRRSVLAGMSTAPFWPSIGLAQSRSDVTYKIGFLIVRRQII